MATRLPIDPRSSQNLWDNRHKALASEQSAWVISAEELLRAFEMLAQQSEEDVRPGRDITAPFGVSNVAMMLGALAIENLLKAVCLPQVSPLFNKRGAFDLDTHDLLKLAEDAGIALSQEERILLERLEQFITWAGRYPVPLRSGPMRPRTLPNGSCAPLTVHTIPDDFAAVSAFAQKLKGMLPTISYATQEP